MPGSVGGSAPGGSAPGGSAPGFGTAAGFGNPSSAGGYPSHANYASGAPSGFGGPGNMAPAKKGGGLAMGLIALVLVGGLVVLGGGIVALVALTGDDETDEDGALTQVRIDTNIASGELVVDGVSRGPVVSGQQIELATGSHALEIRENGQVISEGAVQVVEGQATVVSMNRMVAANAGGPAQVVTGSLRPGDEETPDGKFVDRHAVSWSSGQAQVDLDSADFDTFLEVISPSGRRFTNDDRGDGSLNSSLLVAITEPGQWTLVVTTFSPGTTGDYTLSVRHM